MAVEAGDVLAVFVQTFSNPLSPGVPVVTSSGGETIAAQRTRVNNDFGTDFQSNVILTGTVTASGLRTLTLTPWGTDDSLYVAVVRGCDPAGAVHGGWSNVVPGTWTGSGNVDPVNLIPYSAHLVTTAPNTLVLAIAADEWAGPHPAAVGTGALTVIHEQTDQWNWIAAGSLALSTGYTLTMDGPNSRSSQNYLGIALKGS